MKDPDKDKEFYERKDPFEDTIEHTFATTSITERGNEYEDKDEEGKRKRKKTVSGTR